MEYKEFYDLNLKVREKPLKFLETVPFEKLTKESGLGYSSIRNMLAHIQETEDFWVGKFLKNEPFDISINHHYLLDGLKIIPTEHVIIEYTGQGSPLVIRPEHSTKDLTYLIMPLRK